jgi:hypothetical protein
MESDVDSLSLEVEDDFFDLLFLLVNFILEVSDLDFLDHLLSSVPVFVEVLVFDLLFFVIEFDLLVLQEVFSPSVFLDGLSAKDLSPFDQSIMESQRIEVDDPMYPIEMVDFLLV